MILQLSFVFACALIHRIQGSALHGACLSNDDCGTIDTYCKNQTCICRENFAVWYDSCVQMPTPPISCSKKQGCHSKIGARSMCTKKGQCACKPFHHLHQGQCIKNRDLDDQCEHDHQCYCGANCEQKIACIHKNCSCKPGHKPYKIRRCIHDPLYVDSPDQSLLSTTVHKNKSVIETEHKSPEQTVQKSTEKSEPKSTETTEQNSTESEYTPTEHTEHKSSKQIEHISVKITDNKSLEFDQDAFEQNENSLDLSFQHDPRSGSTTLIIKKYCVVLLFWVTICNL